MSLWLSQRSKQLILCDCLCLLQFADCMLVFEAGKEIHQFTVRQLNASSISSCQWRCEFVRRSLLFSCSLSSVSWLPFVLKWRLFRWRVYCRQSLRRFIIEMIGTCAMKTVPVSGPWCRTTSPGRTSDQGPLSLCWLVDELIFHPSISSAVGNRKCWINCFVSWKSHGYGASWQCCRCLNLAMWFQRWSSFPSCWLPFLEF